jgi:predicted solute-binding protein
LVKEWSAKLPIPSETIRTYLTGNIFYNLDKECQNGLKTFYKLAAKYEILPKFFL